MNFRKIIPMANLFKSSEVLKHLNEGAVKTKFDMENEYSTFLKKPNKNSQPDHDICGRHNIFFEYDIYDKNNFKDVYLKEENDDITDDYPTLLKCEEEEQYIADASQLLKNSMSNISFLNAEYKDNDHMNITVNEAVQTTDEAVDEAANEIPCVFNYDTVEKIGDKYKLKEDIYDMENKLFFVQTQLKELSELPISIQATIENLKRQIAEIEPMVSHQSMIEEINRNETFTEQILNVENEKEQINTVNVQCSNFSTETNVGDVPVSASPNILNPKEPETIEQKLNKMKTVKVYQQQKEKWFSDKKQVCT